MKRLQGSLDANVLVRLLTNDVPHLFSQAKKLVESGFEFYVSDTAVIETIYAINEYYKVPRPLTKQAIMDLATNKCLRINTEIFEPTLDLFIEHPSLSIEDCYLTASAQYNNALPLWTFDKKLVAKGGTSVKNPSEFIN